MRLRFHTVAAEDRAWQVGRLWKGFRTLTGPHQARSSIIGQRKASEFLPFCAEQPLRRLERAGSLRGAIRLVVRIDSQNIVDRRVVGSR